MRACLSEPSSSSSSSSKKRRIHVQGHCSWLLGRRAERLACPTKRGFSRGRTGGCEKAACQVVLLRCAAVDSMNALVAGQLTRQGGASLHLPFVTRPGSRVSTCSLHLAMYLGPNHSVADSWRVTSCRSIACAASPDVEGDASTFFDRSWECRNGFVGCQLSRAPL